MTTRIANLPSPSLPWVDPATGQPKDGFRLFMTLFAAGNLGPFVQAANDAAAAKAGVAVGGVYQNPTTGALFGRRT
jgi:hypothetical protein